MKRDFATPMLLAGSALIAIAFAWWAIVFSTVLRADLLSGSEAVKCIGVSTGLCALASALCSGQHILDIRWYSPALFWLGLTIVAFALSVRTSGRIV